MKRFTNWRKRLDFGTGSLGDLGCHILDHPDTTDACVRQVEGGRRALVDAAERLGLSCPPCPANFQLLEVPPGDDVQRVMTGLRREGYLVKGGFAHPSVARCIRVTLGDAELMTRFAGALARVMVSAHV